MDGKTCCENAWRQRGATGAGAGARAGAWCRTSVRVAEKNLDRDRIAEQRLVNRDGPHNHGLNGRELGSLMIVQSNAGIMISPVAASVVAVVTFEYLPELAAV